LPARRKWTLIWGRHTFLTPGFNDSDDDDAPGSRRHLVGAGYASRDVDGRRD
jgi:hypothetical protein